MRFAFLWESGRVERICAPNRAEARRRMHNRNEMHRYSRERRTVIYWPRVVGLVLFK